MAPIRVNVFARDLGWLFEDMKQHFLRAGVPGVSVVASEEPCLDVDAWVALRTREARASPVPGRTAVCIHDLFDEPGLYAPDGDRGGVHGAGGIVLCHPHQRRLLMAADVRLDRAHILERPIGALTSFAPADRRNERFTIGWVGRDHWRKRLDWFVEAVDRFARGRTDFDVVLIGSGLERATRDLQQLGIDARYYPRELYPIEAYPRLYRLLDVLVITSQTEAGPLTLFEALASGLAIVATPVGWAPWFSRRAPRSVRIATTPAEIGEQIGQVEADRDALFEDRHGVAAMVGDWSLEGWVRDVVRLAASLTTRPAGPHEPSDAPRPRPGRLAR
jgi:glycosyltransferase involved in cell wall biosynthesis